MAKKNRSVAVVAHSGKKLGAGLGELRRVLAAAGYRRPIWYEVPKSRKAPKAVRRAVKKGAKLIFVWGGDGMVQRCVDALAGNKKVELAILPAGTANLLATNLGIPKHVARAVRIGLHGARRRLDVGAMNGERFAVMAGTGFDAIMVGNADAAGKKRLGRLAYVRSAVKAVRASAVRMTVRVDGVVWFKGKASAALVGNVGTVATGLSVFPDASACDGMLEIGVVTATSVWQWARVLSRVARHQPDRSPFVEMTRGKKIDIELGRKMVYQLDGGVRPPARRIKVRVKAEALTVCAPRARATARVSHRRRRVPRPALPPPATTEAVVAAPPRRHSDGQVSPHSNS
jgi:YegS/Rv2252/BmrU family lipid kinase